MATTDQISEITLQHKKISQSSMADLSEVIVNSTKLRLAVAFWAILPDKIDKSLSDLLKKPGSFACVDIHLPTNVDHICDLSDNGAVMFFHGKKVAEKNPDGPYKLPANLLHSKILLFDKDDDQAELWVGSHNWTGWALNGVNIEASLRIQLSSQSELYSDCVALLENIKDESHVVESRFRHLYKRAQQVEPTNSAITLKTADDFGHRSLTENRIYIFGTDRRDFKSISNIGRKIHVTIRDSKSKEESIYKAVIKGANFLPKAGRENSWISFEKGFWAIHQRSHEAPILRPESLPGRHMLEEVAYFVVTLFLEELLPHNFRLDPPSSKIPYLYSEKASESSPEDHRNTKKPVIKELPFDRLQDYDRTEENRIKLMYGEVDKETTEYYLEQNLDKKLELEEEIILLGYDEPKPLVQKLILRSRD